MREALKGVPSAKVDKREKAKVSCWRCGRDSHHTLNCFANKDSDGNYIEAPSKVSALSAPPNRSGTPAPILKRPRIKGEDDGDTPPPPGKKARIAGLMTDPRWKKWWNSPLSPRDRIFARPPVDVAGTPALDCHDVIPQETCPGRKPGTEG